MSAPFLHEKKKVVNSINLNCIFKFSSSRSFTQNNASEFIKNVSELYQFLRSISISNVCDFFVSSFLYHFHLICILYTPHTEIQERNKIEI